MKFNPTSNWKGWLPADTKPDWLHRHTSCLLTILITVGSIFSFICGVIVGQVQPPLYRWIMSLLGIGDLP